MIRRSIVEVDRDHRVVKWSLTAAVFALSVGTFAEITLKRTAEDTTKVVAESVADADADRMQRIAG